MLSLTGSIATGQKVLEAASKSIKRTHLELGGKAPVIVFDDADLESVVGGLKAFSFYNAGQDCTAASRIYAGKGIYDKLVADLASAASSIRYNKRDDADERDRPAHLRKAPRARLRLRRSRRQAEARRGRDRRACDRSGKGFFYEPTVVAGAKQEDEIVRREVFGPVVSVTPLRPTSSRRSPGRTIPTTASPRRCGRKDVGKAMAVAARLQYGCTWINCHFMLTNEMPHGGFKNSGYGKDLSIYALEDYTVARHVMVKLA